MRYVPALSCPGTLPLPCFACWIFPACVQVMAIGDGGNDLAMVANVGLGVAMANAVPEVCAALLDTLLRSHMHARHPKSFLSVAGAHLPVQVLEAANVSVASNDEGGVAEAIERFILSRD